MSSESPVFLSKETLLARHTGADLTAQVSQVTNERLLACVQLSVRERSDDADVGAGTLRIVSVFESVVVLSTLIASEIWKFHSAVPVVAPMFTVRVSRRAIGFTSNKRKFLFSLPLDDERDAESVLLPLLDALRTALGQPTGLPTDVADGYLSSLDFNVHYEDALVDSGRGQLVFTQIMVPRHGAPPRALLFIAPGFADVGPNVYNELCLRRDYVVALLRANFAVASLDSIGHGRSEGMPLFVPDFAYLVDDAHRMAMRARARVAELAGIADAAALPVVLHGESMGGNIVMRVSLKYTDSYSRMVLLAPMTRIDDKVKPPAWQVPLLRGLAWLLPSAPLIPNKVLVEAFKYPETIERVLASPLSAPFEGIRLKTADQCMIACETLPMAELTLPFVVVHGKKDSVIPPALSEELHRLAASKKKDIWLIDDLFHAINADEPSLKARVFGDIVKWLTE
jgi:alpha-beta hydrolase superfamily lysophospholipase